MKKIELKEGVVYHMNEIGIENLKTKQHHFKPQRQEAD